MLEGTRNGINPIYDDLRQTTAEELILAVALFYEEQAEGEENKKRVEGLRMAAKIAEPGGWQHVAPAWLRRYRLGVK